MNSLYVAAFMSVACFQVSHALGGAPPPLDPPPINPPPLGPLPIDPTIIPPPPQLPGIFLPPPPPPGNQNNDPFNPLNSINWNTIDLSAQINEKFFNPTNGYPSAGGAPLGFDSVGFEVRTYDAIGNNLGNPEWGSTNSQAVRCVPSAYEDGVQEINGQSRMNAREISNVVSKTLDERDPKFVNDRGLTQFAWQWGQFIDHDVTLISEAAFHEVGPDVEHIDIYIPCNDPDFDADQSDPSWCDADRHIEMARTHEFPGTGTGPDNPRQQLNEITSFVDASMIYGSDEARARALRKFEQGKLLLDEDDFFGFLPSNFDSEANEPNSDASFGIAGDLRSNEQLGLLAMHTIWVRFHNMVADEVRDALRNNRNTVRLTPQELDEKIYQYAKLIVTAVVQKITYEDWLPALFGPTAIRRFLGEYRGYDQDVNGGACLIFSSAAFRFGHTMLPNFLPLRNEDCTFWSDFDAAECPQCDLSIGGIELRNSYFVPQLLENVDGMFEALMNGMSCTLSNEIDVSVTNAVRSFLFESAVFPLGSTDRIFGDLDLMALNIQRGREHGLPDYNSVRELIGLSRLGSFEEFLQAVGDEDLSSNFQEISEDDVDDIDLFLALLAEEHLEDGSFGETMSAIVLQQFARFRDGDRFWYQDYIKPGELMDFVNSMTLKAVVELTTDIDNIGHLDSVRHDIFQSSRAKPIFDGDGSFEDDVFFAQQVAANMDQTDQAGWTHNHQKYSKYHKPQAQPQAQPQPQQPQAQPFGVRNFPSTLKHISNPYVIQMTNTQIALVFAGILLVIGFSCCMLNWLRNMTRKSYKVLKFDTESEMDSDMEQLQK